MLTMDEIGAVRIRGLLPSAHLQWVRDYYGERVAIRVLSILPPEAAAEVNGALPSGWCSFESLLLLDAAIAEVCGRDARQTYRDLGRYTAHIGLTDNERAMIRSDVHRFLRCFAVRDALFQDRGTCTYAQDGPLRGMVIANGAWAWSRVHCDTMAGWLEQVLEVHGAREVRVDERSCRASGADRCAFLLEWESTPDPQSTN
ncbi:MAG: V4R domain-containing protein [Thermoanaerobaculia bacterium]